MSDLVKDIKYLRFYHTQDDALKDKDILKNLSFKDYQHKVGGLFLFPLALQFWQLFLVNNFEKASLYKTIRTFKILSFIGAVAIGVNENWKLEK